MSAPLRVLLVEDSPTDAKLVMHALRRASLDVDLKRVEDEVAMRAALQSGQWDIVLCDWALPNFNALAALDVLTQAALDIPFIIVSGTIGEELAAEAMRGGANDYVLKHNLARLAPAIERELREAGVRRKQGQLEARFRALIEKSADAVALNAEDGTMLYASPAAATILGFAPEDLIGTRFLDHVHVEDRARVFEEMPRTRKTSTENDMLEFRVERPDGSFRWVEATRTNMLSDPAVGGIVCNFRDISERKKATDDLRASEARFARLAESGIVGIAIADVNGRILDVNEACTRMVGYSREELLSGDVRWFELAPPELRHLADRAVLHLKERGVAPPYETETLCKDGTTRPILIGVAMLAYPQCIAFMADLAERKGVEKALRDSETRLRQAQKMEAVGRLAGGVAHDFNNVLSVILSYSDMLLSSLADGNPVRQEIEEIRRAGARAADLTRQLLMFSRQQVVAPRVLDLNELLTGMDRMLRRLLGADVELVSVPTRPLGRTRVDPSSVEQLVMNLVVNARDAMPTGGQLTLATHNVILDAAYARDHFEVTPGPYVMLTVTDTGVGMDKNTMSRMFEPFFTTKERGKGTGLGLSTVFGIVQQSGGSVSVQSELGEGTTFRVYLPSVEANLDPSRSVSPRSNSLRARGSETILVVEDDDQVRAVILGILRKSGYRVIEASNGGEALLHSERYADRIHLLLSDVVMPHMSGPELAKRLANVRPDMKVLCMSGYTDDSVVRHGVLEAHFAFIQKPVTPESLTSRVREVLGESARIQAS